MGTRGNEHTVKSVQGKKLKPLAGTGFQGFEK